MLFARSPSITILAQTISAQTILAQNGALTLSNNPRAFTRHALRQVTCAWYPDPTAYAVFTTLNTATG
eukprot:6870516-Lingulodinium_polyedra.AAC.1